MHFFLEVNPDSHSRSRDILPGEQPNTTHHLVRDYLAYRLNATYGYRTQKQLSGSCSFNGAQPRTVFASALATAPSPGGCAPSGIYQRPLRGVSS